VKKFGFYLLGKKGYQCLVQFFEKYGNEYIAFVVSTRDKGVKDDYFDEISGFCKQKGISSYSRCDDFFKESDLNFAIGWRWIIQDSEKLIVFHDSLLPKYRGFSPLVNMLVRGEEEIGVTALYASHEYDAGDIIDQKSVIINYPIKISDAIDIMSNLYENVLLGLVDQIVAGLEPAAVSQNQSIATFSLWRDDLDYKINWGRNSAEIQRFVDAVGYPYAGAKTKLHGQWVRVLHIELVKDIKIESRESHLGKVIFMNDGYPTVVCGSGLVKLINVVDENGTSLIENIPFRTRFGV
jgi:methionyl-tRNA formyltransferase